MELHGLHRLLSQGNVLCLVLLVVCLISGVKARDLNEIRYNFTTCGATGRSGPSLKECTDYYSELNSPIIRKGKLFGFGDNDYTGAQGFKVPRSGLYNITVAGAAGGRGVCNFEYGRGLVARFQANLSRKDELLILVGQKGLSPCDVNPDYDLCQNSSLTLDESIECESEWNRLLGDVVNLFGGGGGGGASMIWSKNITTGEFSDVPLVIVGGGGGSSAVLSYETAAFYYYLATQWSFPVCAIGLVQDSIDFYQDWLSAKQNTYDECLYTVPGIRGISYRDRFSQYVGLVAGSGGGFMAGLPQLLLDGGLLNEPAAFAIGGLDCISQLSEEINDGNRPFEEVYGGFGGGGGGCGEGGGGGGYTGGPVLWLGDDVPGGGGYSILNVVMDVLGSGGYSGLYGEMDIPERDFSLNDGDGYVEMVPVDCGCVYECVVSGEEFECMCPNGTELAPNLDDCFYGTEINISEGIFNFTNGFRLQALPFGNESSGLYIFNMAASLTTITEEQRNKRDTLQSDEEDSCVILFIGEDSKFVLASYPVQGAGMTTTLAEVTVHIDGNFTFDISEYTDFLSSSVLVTGVILISTGSCSVEGMVIAVNASIQAVDAEYPNFTEILTNTPDTFSTFVRHLLLLDDATPPDVPPTSDSTDNRMLIGLVVAAGVIVVIVVLAISLLIGYRVYLAKMEKPEGIPHIRNPGIATMSLATNPEYMRYHTRYAASVNPSGRMDGYETLSFAVEGGELSESMQMRQLTKTFASKYGVNAPNYDFSGYNRSRIDSLTSSWQYPRRNLIYMRELGEGQFGKVLLMKAEGIAGFRGEIPVAVKTLSSRDPQIVKKFLEEADLMKKFSHPNIISLLGISTDSDEDSAPLMILEYMPYGDLQGFLESHRPSKMQKSPITEKYFYSFATDVAKAMEFLSERKYVHRDVAARNCLVGSGLKIKIADFGLARGVYDKDYYRVAGRTVLPVRWMAPESLLYGVFTTASDVWSYGVLLWEILSFGAMPLEDLKVQEIVELAQHGTLQHPRPDNCPGTLYKVMTNCHNHDGEMRPSFTEILTDIKNNTPRPT